MSEWKSEKPVIQREIFTLDVCDGLRLRLHSRDDGYQKWWGNVEISFNKFLVGTTVETCETELIAEMLPKIEAAVEKLKQRMKGENHADGKSVDA
jgi:hypothetical protein